MIVVDVCDPKAACWGNDRFPGGSGGDVDTRDEMSRTFLVALLMRIGKPFKSVPVRASRALIAFTGSLVFTKANVPLSTTSSTWT